MQMSRSNRRLLLAFAVVACFAGVILTLPKNHPNQWHNTTVTFSGGGTEAVIHFNLPEFDTCMVSDQGGWGEYLAIARDGEPVAMMTAFPQGEEEQTPESLFQTAYPELSPVDTVEGRNNGWYFTLGNGTGGFVTTKSGLVLAAQITKPQAYLPEQLQAFLDGITVRIE